MAEGRPNVGDYIEEFHREATKLLDLVKEVADHHNNGKHESAASVAALSHYNITHLATAREGVLDAYKQQGFEAGDFTD